MATNVIDAKQLALMFLSGAKALEAQKEYINELNVFPVPDGDTGTNMTLTVMSAAKEVYALGDNPSMVDLCKAMSSGSLKGARGNSGVILSQLLRGFTKVIKEYETLDVVTLAIGAEKAVESAYKAVMKPKEGTILSVARAMSEKAGEIADSYKDDLSSFAQNVIDAGEKMLAHTPELLPVLKEAGVVDSGGQGLMEVIKGAYQAYLGFPIPFSLDENGETNEKKEAVVKKNAGKAYQVSMVLWPKKEFDKKSEKELTDALGAIGDSVVISIASDNVSVSVSSNDPGIALQKCVKMGAVTDINIENVLFEKPVKKESAPVQKPVEKQPYGFISVAAGEGMTKLFEDLGVNVVISGGQTMNPSTEDFLNAISGIAADTIFILPNNKNIIMAANQAAELTTDKKVIVLPTKTMPQGISTLVSFVPSVSPEENESAMNEAAGIVKTASVTYAVRDTVIDGIEIHKDDYMAVGDDGILSCGKDLTEVMKDLVSKITDEDTALVSVYYGQDITEEAAMAMEGTIGEMIGEADLEFQNGGQPVYYYIVSAE